MLRIRFFKMRNVPSNKTTYSLKHLIIELFLGKVVQTFVSLDRILIIFLYIPFPKFTYHHRMFIFPEF